MLMMIRRRVFTLLAVGIGLGCVLIIIIQTVYMKEATNYTLGKETTEQNIHLKRHSDSKRISENNSPNNATPTYTRMKYGPVFILGVVGGNFSAVATWDHFKIYGMLDRKLYGTEPLACCLMYREKDKIIIIKSRTISEKRFPVPADMVNFHVGCPNVKHAQGYIPIGLAVTIFDNGTCAENHVTYVQPYFPVKEPSKIVIGSKLTYGTMSAELMIEWIESMKYIGVDKIITYYMRGLNTDALNVLYNYASKGILDLHFYEPANEEVYPRVDNFVNLIKQQWNDQATVVYDSFERASGCRYFAIIDQDEFFIPGKNRTIKEMFDNLEQSYHDHAGFILRSQYYYLSWGKSSNNTDTILGSYTTRETTAPRFDNQKAFQIPARVAIGGTDTHEITAVAGFRMYPLAIEAGYIRHFRHCRPKKYKECMTNVTRVLDKEVSNWAEGFRDKVAEVRKTVLGL